MSTVVFVVNVSWFIVSKLNLFSYFNTFLLKKKPKNIHFFFWQTFYFVAGFLLLFLVAFFFNNFVFRSQPHPKIRLHNDSTDWYYLSGSRIITLNFLCLQVTFYLSELLISMWIEFAELCYKKALASRPIPSLPATEPSSRRKHKRKSLKAASRPMLYSILLKSLTGPLRFSCAHAHVVNEMADLATASARKGK